MARRIVLLALAALLCATLATAQTIVDIANDATDPNNLDDSEPSIAVDPTNTQRIAVVSFSGGWANGGRAPVWMSTDGGTTWSKLNILPAPANGSTGPGDQKLVWGTDGKLYITELGFGVNPPRCFIYRPIAVNTYAVGAAYGDDQPHIDRYNDGTFMGRLLSPWLNSGVSPEQSNVTRTTDNGVTVTSVAAGNNSFPNRTTRIAISPFNNRAYIIYKQRQGQVAGTPFENATFRVARSDDGGASWGAIGPAGAGGVAITPSPVQTWFTSDWGDPAKGRVGRARSSDAWIAVNPSNGDVWATFCNRNAAGLGQIYAAISSNGGATWSAPKQVSDGTRNSAYPEIAVAANGSIGVLYVDYDASGAQTVFRHRFGRSFNSGVSWTTSTLDSFSTQQLSNGTNRFLWGDYEGLTAVGNTFFGVFTGKSINRANVQFDPIFFSASAVGSHHDPLCQTEQPGFSATYHGTPHDLNDYGAIHMDADSSGECAKLAHDALITKLKTTPDAVFAQPLQGYYLALIFAAAQRIAAHGWFNTATDPASSLDTLAGQLDRVMGLYQVTSHEGQGCGTGFEGNSCMDDHAGAAAAYAWMSAFKKKRGDGDTWSYATEAHNYINNYFANVCIHNSNTFNGTNICNGAVSELGGFALSGPAEVLTFEHSRQSPHHGLGLMTSITSAVVGVEAAGAAIPFTEEQKIKAHALFREVQDHTDDNFAYTSDCADPNKNPETGVWSFGAPVPCTDSGYDPRMYHLAEIYETHLGGTPTGTYQSDDACCTSYPHWDVNDFDEFFGAGRYVTYHDQGWKWYEVRADQSRYMPFDLHPAKGFMDGVSDTGAAFGWACDPDAPNSWVKVDLYANGTKIADDQTQYAWWPSSHPQINTECGGGTNHGFLIQLPGWTQGQTITAKARDFTFGPDAPVPCFPSPTCTWTVAAPTGLVATAVTTSQINVSWTASSGATQYEILRAAAPGGYSVLTVTSLTSYTDLSVVANRAYAYKVRAIAPAPSQFSTPDAATTIAFTNDPFIAATTRIRAVHLTEVRSGVNALRAAAGLSAFTFTDPVLTSSVRAKAVHLSQVRTALSEARDVLGLPPASYMNPTLVPGTTRIRAVHLQEVRDLMK